MKKGDHLLICSLGTVKQVIQLSLRPATVEPCLGSSSHGTATVYHPFWVCKRALRLPSDSIRSPG